MSSKDRRLAERWGFSQAQVRLCEFRALRNGTLFRQEAKKLRESIERLRTRAAEKPPA